MKHWLDCKCSLQNTFNTKIFNSHQKPILLLNLAICSQSIKRIWWPVASITSLHPIMYRRYTCCMCALLCHVITTLPSRQRKNKSKQNSELNQYSMISRLKFTNYWVRYEFQTYINSCLSIELLRAVYLYCLKVYHFRFLSDLWTSRKRLMKQLSYIWRLQHSIYTMKKYFLWWSCY